MSHTSTAVKAKYNAKTYKRWLADLKIADYERIEKVRNEMNQTENISRAKFLNILVENFENRTK